MFHFLFFLMADLLDIINNNLLSTDDMKKLKFKRLFSMFSTYNLLPEIDSSYRLLELF